jgi:O-succinylbenzoic acid--CoA ligase
VSQPLLLRAGGDRADLAITLQQAFSAGQTVAIAAPEEVDLLEAALPARIPTAWGAALVLGTGGSSGGRRWCVQPLAHLQVALAGTAQWLQALGLEPAQLELFNPLPPHHVSGLMPLLRARAWGAELRWLPPAWMREPEQLMAEASPATPDRAVLSLVPTQLQRLLDGPAGIRWLERFALIWMGGAALPPALAQRCRALGIRLAPCYGSTETGAMVMALPPQRFLAGVEGCGAALPHVQLRVEPGSGALQIKAASLALGMVQQGELQPLPLDQGWWSSGDRAELGVEGWQLLGRLDGAIHSGGETVFPEQVEQRLLALARVQGLPVEELLLLPEPDPLWGERLAALVRPAAGIDAGDAALWQSLQTLALTLPPSQRPRRWLLCPELQRSPLGKWERRRWGQWLSSHPASQPAPEP